MRNNLERIVHKILDRCENKEVGFLTFKIVKGDLITNKNIFKGLKERIEIQKGEILIVTEWDKLRMKQHYHCIIIGEKDYKEEIEDWIKEFKGYSITYEYYLTKERTKLEIEEGKRSEKEIKIKYTIKQSAFFERFDVYYTEQKIMRSINRIRVEEYKRMRKIIGEEITQEKWFVLCVLEDVFKEFYEGDKEFSKWAFWTWVVNTKLFVQIIKELEKKLNIERYSNEKEYNLLIEELFEEFLNSADLRIWVLELKRSFKHKRIRWIEELKEELRLDITENQVEKILDIINQLLDNNEQLVNITKKEIVGRIKNSKWITIEEKKAEKVIEKILEYLKEKKYIIYFSYTEDDKTISYYKLLKGAKWQELYKGFKLKALKKQKTGVMRIEPEPITEETLRYNPYKYGYILNSVLEIRSIFKNKIDNKIQFEEEPGLKLWIAQTNIVQRQAWTLDDLSVEYFIYLRSRIFKEEQQEWLTNFEKNFEIYCRRMGSLEKLYNKMVKKEEEEIWDNLYISPMFLYEEVLFLFKKNGYDLSWLGESFLEYSNYNILEKINYNKLLSLYKEEDISFIIYATYRRAVSSYRNTLKSYSKYLEIEMFYNFLKKFRGKKFYYVYFFCFRGRRYVNGFVTALNNIWLRQVVIPYNKKDIIEHSKKRKYLNDLQIFPFYTKICEKLGRQKVERISDLFECIEIDKEFIKDFENKKNYLRNLIIIFKIYWSQEEDVNLPYLIFNDFISSGSQIMSYFIMDKGLNPIFKLFFDKNSTKPDTYQYILNDFSKWLQSKECAVYLKENKSEFMSNLKLDDVIKFMELVNSTNSKNIRSIVKKAIMTVFYNVSLRSMSKYMYAAFKELKLVYNTEQNKNLKQFVTLFCTFLNKHEIRNIIRNKTKEVFDILKMYNQVSFEYKLIYPFINYKFNYSYFNIQKEEVNKRKIRKLLKKLFMNSELEEKIYIEIFVVYLDKLLSDRVIEKLITENKQLKKQLLKKKELNSIPIEDLKERLKNFLLKKKEFLLNKKRKNIFIDELLDNDEILFKIQDKFSFLSKLLKKRNKKYMHVKDKTALMPNLIHSIDATIVFLILKYLFADIYNGMSIFIIHDSFGTQYSDINKIKEVCNKATLYLIKNLNYYDVILNSPNLKQFKYDFNLYSLNFVYSMYLEQLDIENQREKNEGRISNIDSENIKKVLHFFLNELSGISLKQALQQFEEIKKDEEKYLLLQRLHIQKRIYNQGRKERIEFCKNENDLIKNLFLTALE